MRGYTMIELIIVMLVLAILGAVALPVFSSKTTLNVRGTRDQVRAMLEYSRKLAVAQRRDVCILISPPLVQAVYVVAATCSAASPVSPPSNRTGAYTSTIPTDVSITGATLVQFDQNGRPVPNADLTINFGDALGNVLQSLLVSNETGLVYYP